MLYRRLQGCFFLSPANKSDSNIGIPDSLWPYTKNAEHPESELLKADCDTKQEMISYHSILNQNPKPNETDAKYNLIFLNAYVQK